MSVKKSKKGTLKQIVPQYSTLKNAYTLLWDMNSNEGYIKVVAVMQKYFDQAISGNWSYNPENYENNEVPISVMAQDLLTTYKYGWKTSYYQNTYDGKTDDEVDDVSNKTLTENLRHAVIIEDEEACDACANIGRKEMASVFNQNKVDFTKQSMFFGEGPQGMQRYDEFKYPIFDKLHRSS